MRRLIDANALEDRFSLNCGGECAVCSYNNTLCDIITEAPTVEAIPKADYETRLKADMVAMLTEIQLEIEELKNEPYCCEHYVRGINNSSNVIQQKINALNVESEDSTPREAVDVIPRERIEQIVAEIEKEAAESVYPECASLYWALDVIHKYTKEQNNE